MKLLAVLVFASLTPACMIGDEGVSDSTAATTGTGTSSTLLGRGTYQSGFVIRDSPGFEVAVQAFQATDVAVQQITFAPGGKSGWHSHPGPVFITVQQGTMTFYDSANPQCAPVTVTAGHGFVDGGTTYAHMAINQTGDPATNVVVYLAPVGGALKIDQPQPSNCPTM
jgi:hypothetical protein